METVRTCYVASKDNRIVTGRLFPKTDLLEGLEKVCLENGITSGIILNGIGSLSKAYFTYAVPDKEGKIGIKYTDYVSIDGPFELLNCTGYIGKGESLSIHLHGVFSGPDMRVYGAHFVKGGNITLATVEFTILDLSDVELIRKYDNETGFSLFNFSKRTK